MRLDPEPVDHNPSIPGALVAITIRAEPLIKETAPVPAARPVPGFPNLM